ncbi:MAG: L,D-transpeptidase [Candidatus Sumerlaeaceae bacterium]|nr:L,D-transpeptidase [Candidatus Sumerlaeaceae bacterium]
MKLNSLKVAAWFVLVCGVLLTASPCAAAWPWQRQAPKQQVPQLRMDEVQILLDRCGFSVGQIDGKPGGNTNKAVAAFQQAQGVQPTGELDARTMDRLWSVSGGSPWMEYTITDEDTTGPFIGELPPTMEEKSKLDYLGYTSINAKLAEKFHINAGLLQSYNPNKPFRAGQTIQAPNVVPMELSKTGKAVAGQAWGEFTIVASKNNLTLQLLDSQNRILFHAPMTAGGKNDPLPLGQWKVEGVDRNPTYHYDPSLFWDAKTSDTKCILPPGPNNPVGVAWVNLNKEHVGIHGTPSPGKIGYAVSHGCVRLTNWDVLRLAAMIGPGTNVLFTE